MRSPALTRSLDGQAEAPDDGSAAAAEESKTASLLVADAGVQLQPAAAETKDAASLVADAGVKETKDDWHSGWQWSAAAAAPHWLHIDLGRSCDVSRVDFRWQAFFVAFSRSVDTSCSGDVTCEM